MKRALLTVLAGLLLAATAGATQIQVNVAIDTTAYNGQTALLELQLAPGVVSDPASVTIENFWTDGALGAPWPSIGTVNGTLPGYLQIVNDAPFGDYAQYITLGNTIRFQAIFTGIGVESPTGLPFGSDFVVFLFGDPDGAMTPLLTTEPEGYLLRVGVPPTGGVGLPQTFDAAVTAGEPAAVPEPGTVALLGAGLAGLVFLKRRR